MEDGNRETMDRMHVFVCKGQTCSRQGNPDDLKVRIKQGVRGLDARRIKISHVTCLGLCGTGPNILVCSGGEVFHRSDASVIEAVLDAVRNGLSASPDAQVSDSTKNPDGLDFWKVK